jgi:polar amino acid transport system permease protein
MLPSPNATASEQLGHADSAAALQRSAPEPLVPRRHHLRTALAIVVGVYLLAVLQSLVLNERFNWPVVGKYLFDPMVLGGVLNTCLLTVLSMSLGLVLAFLVAQLALSASRLLRAAAVVFVWIFRSVPLLVLLLLLYNIGALYDVIPIGVPFGPAFIELPTTGISAFVVAVIAFAFHEAAYSSEIIRASILSVPRGQSEAAMALGMSSARTTARVVLPSALRVALPPLMNQLIMMLKGTSIVAFIAFPDLLFSVQKIYTVNYEVMALLVVASGWYFVLVSALTVVQQLVERRLARTTRRRGTMARAA